MCWRTFTMRNTALAGLVAVSIIFNTSTGSFIPGVQKSAQKCYIYNLGSHGLGSNLQGLLMALAVWGDPQLNNTIYVNEEDWVYKCSSQGSWNQFFEGWMPIQLPAGKDAKVMKKKCLEVGYGDSEDAFVHFSQQRHASFTVEDAFHILAPATKQLWLMSEDFTGVCSKQWEHYDLLRKPIAGIHIRAGDKVLEDHAHQQWHNNNEWVSNFQSVTKKHSREKVRTCLMFGDQPAAIWNATRVLHAQGIFPSLHMISGDQETHSEQTFAHQSEQDRCASTKAILMEIDALARCDTFIGSMNSNLPRFVALLRAHVYNKPMNSSVDASGAFRWHYNYRETELEAFKKPPR